MAPGQMMLVKLPATPETFTGWIAHAKAGGGEGSQTGGEGVGEHGAGRLAGGEHGARGVGAHNTGSEQRGDG